MNSLEASIRSAIKKANAYDPEARNQIYLAAREVIQQSPDNALGVTVDELVKIVTKIETDYALAELAAQEKQQKTLSQPSIGQKLTALPWFAIMVTIAILAVMGFSTFLLYSQIQQQNKTSLSETGQGNLHNLFRAEITWDLLKFSNQPSGKPSLEMPEKIRDKDLDAFPIKRRFSLYSKDRLQLRPDRIYRVKLRLSHSPPKADIVLNAGFSSTLSNNGKTEDIRNAFFLHQGNLKPARVTNGKAEYYFSSLIDWEDLENSLDLNDPEREVRVVISGNANGENAVVRISNFAVDEIS
ncbi:MAG: hypothetical protein AAF217_10600 [Pseudomonadota bacterium]